MSDNHMVKHAAVEVGLGATAELLKRSGSPAAAFVPHHGHAAQTGAQLVNGAAVAAPAVVAAAVAAAPVVLGVAVITGALCGGAYLGAKLVEWFDE